MTRSIQTTHHELRTTYHVPRTIHLSHFLQPTSHTLFATYHALRTTHYAPRTTYYVPPHPGLCERRVGRLQPTLLIEPITASTPLEGRAPGLLVIFVTNPDATHLAPAKLQRPGLYLLVLRYASNTLDNSDMLRHLDILRNCPLDLSTVWETL